MLVCALYDGLFSNKNSLFVDSVDGHRIDKHVEIVTMMQMAMRDENSVGAAYVDAAECGLH